MEDDVAEVHHHPAIAGKPLFSGFLFIFLFDLVHSDACQRVQHSVAGAGADDEIIGEGGDIFDIEQYDVFAFFIFEGVDNVACEVQCIQGSPQWGGK